MTPINNIGTNTRRYESGIQKEEKEKAVLRELMYCTYDDNDDSIEKPWMLRYNLRLTIGKALSELLHKPIDHCTIHSNINYLLGLNFITQNPTSHITVNNNILPDNMTKYFINAETIHDRLKELVLKESEFHKLKGKISLSLSLASFNQSEKVESQSHETKISQQHTLN